jgi:hypothetical protein
LAGKSGRKTADACDTNASEMSADTTARWIVKGGQSGLLTRIAMMESVSLGARMN